MHSIYVYTDIYQGLKIFANSYIYISIFDFNIFLQVFKEIETLDLGCGVGGGIDNSGVFLVRPLFLVTQFLILMYCHLNKCNSGMRVSGQTIQARGKFRHKRIL